MYHYKCKVLNVVDGDTVDVEFDLGFRFKMIDRIRLYGINAPELRSSIIEERCAAVDARRRLIELCVGVDSIRTQLDKRDKYGRMLGSLYIGDNVVSVNETLVAEHHAKEYML